MATFERNHKVVYACPPLTCDICDNPIEGEFYDFRTRDGRWANGCPACFVRLQGRLGTGIGQKYVKNLDNKFEKVAG